jgi:hypothetical protein
MTNLAHSLARDDLDDLVIIESSVDENPVAEQLGPGAQRPAAQQPIATQPVVEQPVVERSVIEHTEVPRAAIGMRGNCQIEGWRDAEGNVRQFECTILKISPQAISLSAPVTGAVGKWVVVQFEHLGKLEGPIIQIQKQSLVLKIFGTNEDRTKLANKLAWISNAQKTQGRQHPRIVPVNPESIVTLPGTPPSPCEVIDYSLSGVAVYAEVEPAIGSVVRIGKVFGRVARAFGGGFAVTFVTLQDPHTVEAAILQPPAPSQPA